MTRLIRIGVDFVDSAALGVAAEEADRTEDHCYHHLDHLNAAAPLTPLDQLPKRSNALPVTEIRFAHFKMISPKQQRIWETSHWSSLRNASFEWRLKSAQVKLNRN